MLFLYDCKSTSIAIYSQDEVVTCISGGIMQDVHNLFCTFSDAVGVFEYRNKNDLYISSYIMHVYCY